MKDFKQGYVYIVHAYKRNGDYWRVLSVCANHEIAQDQANQLSQDSEEFMKTSIEQRFVQGADI